MKILLDTCVILWVLSGPDKLTPRIEKMICDERNEIYVSVASLCEIALKHKKYPDQFPFTSEQIKNYCMRSGYYFVSLSVDNLTQFEKLDFKEHKDPFDKMLISQSVSNGFRLITHDKMIKDINLGFIEYF